MLTPILATKLHIPLPRPKAVLRTPLIARLNEGAHHKLTLISAPAGFGKTTLVSEWATRVEQPIAWLSLDDRDNDPIRFLMYLAAALQTIDAPIGDGVLGALHSPQPPPIEVILTLLLNDLAGLPHAAVLILDDYHVIDARPVNDALLFLIEHLPAQLHLIIASRETPSFPLARYRAGGQLTELRAADLRFTLAEAAEFLNQGMGLTLSEDLIAALEQRTEGWIAGLQMAALSMQGRDDTAGFIRAFTGSHHFVLDYLVEEVLRRQPASVQTFLLQTSILDRLCGPLCDAVVLAPSGTGQTTLESLEQGNLFILPLDHERRWYRYHHLFADLLRQRLRQSVISASEHEHPLIDALHIRASQWYEDNDLMVEAFHHAVAANDVARAARLIEGPGIPLHFRGAVASILDWLASLPKSVLDARPALWVRYSTLMLVVGQTTGVDEKLQAAETALQGAVLDHHTRNLIGQIAAARSTLALTRYQTDEMMAQSRRALAYLPADNLSFRATTLWTLGYGYALQGDRTQAAQTFTEAIALSQAAGDTFAAILSTIGLGQVQEAETQLHQAFETFQRVLQLAGHQPLQIIYEAHLGLAHIYYEWNELEKAQKAGQQSLQLAQQYDRVIDRFVVCELFLVRVLLAQGDITGAAALLAQVDQSVRRNHFVHRIPEVAAAQVRVLLHQGHVAAAAQIVQAYDLPLSQARVALAQGDAAKALTILTTLRQQAEAKNLADERLRMMVLQALALKAHSKTAEALQVLKDALLLAEPGGFIRLFLDEGPPMADLLHEGLSQGLSSEFMLRLLAAFPSSPAKSLPSVTRPSRLDLAEPLSEREIEVLQLMAEGLTNQDIATRLTLSLHTVKVHVRNINGKLDTSNRTQAVARGRALGLLTS